MKKKNIINLIRFHIEKRDQDFQNEALEIANCFESAGDDELHDYILSLISGQNTFVPQEMSCEESTLFRIVKPNADPLPLPAKLSKDIKGIANAINRNIGINKFLFSGTPGTGKTETAKQLARLLGRQLVYINFSSIIDCKLGQTQKNLEQLFNSIRHDFVHEDYVFLFDEIDAIALDRTNANDVREMGRVTSTFLKKMDEMEASVVLIATTNLYKYLDDALVRRFDATVDFDCYEKEDLIRIGEILLDHFCNKFKFKKVRNSLFIKILNLPEELPSPGILKNIIRTSIAFSDPNDSCDYLKRIYYALVKRDMPVEELRERGFTLREIELLTGISKTEVSRQLQK